MVDNNNIDLMFTSDRKNKSKPDPVITSVGIVSGTAQLRLSLAPKETVAVSNVRGDAEQDQDIKCVTDDSFSSDIPSNKVDKRHEKHQPFKTAGSSTSPASKRDQANFETNRGHITNDQARPF